MEKKMFFVLGLLGAAGCGHKSPSLTAQPRTTLADDRDQGERGREGQTLGEPRALGSTDEGIVPGAESANRV